MTSGACSICGKENSTNHICCLNVKPDWEDRVRALEEAIINLVKCVEKGDCHSPCTDNDPCDVCKSTAKLQKYTKELEGR